MTHDDIRRRLVLGLAAGWLPLPGCAQSTAVLCPKAPGISDLQAPLTIDVHAHVFNGADLQIKEFIAQTVVGQDSELSDLADFLGGVLQHLAWHNAPGAREEHVALDRYAAVLAQQCGDAQQLRTLAGESFQDGYARGRRELKLAAAQVASGDSNAARVLGPRAEVDGAGLGPAIDALPARFEDFESELRQGASVLGSQPHLLGYLHFVLHQFNFRHVNAIDYLTTYSPRSARKIDLLVPSMVDYDWWLAKGRPTATSLDDQVDLMARIAVLSGGRMHGFVAFCPFREAMTSVQGQDGQAMALVKRAVTTQGFIGVKLYPPMGFAAWGNSALQVWKGKATLPAAAHEAVFGARLDAAMQRLFDWCQANDVPIMAHANRSNGPYPEFRDLAGSEHWSRALDRFPGLKVSFGHFGDTDLEDHGGDRSRLYRGLMTPAGTKGAQVFADSSYFAGVISNPNGVTDVLRALLSPAESPVLAERLMYGTDWTMILPQKNVERYLAEFVGVMAKLDSGVAAPRARNGRLSDAFFGRNAIEYLGLTRGKPARARLEAFYARHRVDLPDWMEKVDRT